MYNAEAFVSATLSSILQERAIDLEVVVVNDGSTDRSLERVRAVNDARIRVIEGPRQGISASLNAGIAAARADIIMRCDADDLYPAGRIAAQASWLSQHPDYGAVCGGYSAVDPEGHLITQFTPHLQAQDITQELRSGITATHYCTFAVRAKILKTTGGCRQYFKTAEDIDLQLRIGETCSVFYLPESQYNYRLHNASITHVQASTERKFFEQIAAEFQRQRLLQGSDDLQRGCPPPLPESAEDRPMQAGEHIQELLIYRAWQEHQAGYKLQAMATAVRSVMSQPRAIAAWSNLLALSVKPTKPTKPTSKKSRP